MNFRAAFFTAGFVVLAALAPPSAHAMGLGPGLFKVQNVPPGRPVDVRKAAGVVFTIKNDTNQEAEYTLSCRKPSQGGLVTWEEGYDEIPDASWCKLEKAEFSVPANSNAETGLTIEVPDKPEYYNCKWILAVLLTAGKNKGIGVGLAVAARVQIETLPSAEKESGGAAAIATIPSLIQVSGKPGDTFTRSVLLGNNTVQALPCSPERLVSVYPKDEFKYARYASTGYQQLLKESWLSWPKDEAQPVTLKPGEKQEHKISGRIPQTVKPGEKWEELVFFTAPAPEQKNKDVAARPARTFFRVQYQIAGGAEEQKQ